MLAGLALLIAAQAPDLGKPFEAIAAEGFNGTVLVVDGGKVKHRAGYGVLDPATKNPMPADAAFCIGSVAKWFTGILVLKLQSEKKLALEDPISKFISNVPTDKQGITVRQLLTHSAGLGEYIDRPGEGGDFAAIDKATALKRAMEDRLLFAPGTRSEYSNVAYTVLAAILEKVSGQSFEDLTRQEIIQKAGLKRTGFDGDGATPATAFAVGQNAKTHGKVNSPFYWPKPSWALKGSGGIYSTVDDLGRLMQAITEGKILSPSVEPQLFQPLFEAEGYGWLAIKSKAGTPFCNVGGGNNFGFNAALCYLPKEGRLVVACSSANTPMKMQNAVQATLKALSTPPPTAIR